MTLIWIFCDLVHTFFHFILLLMHQEYYDCETANKEFGIWGNINKHNLFIFLISLIPEREKDAKSSQDDDPIFRASILMTNSQNTDFWKVGLAESFSETFIYDGKIKLQHPEKLKPILAWAQGVMRYFDKMFSLQPPRDAVTIMSILRLSLTHATITFRFFLGGWCLKRLLQTSVMLLKQQTHALLLLNSVHLRWFELWAFKKFDYYFGELRDTFIELRC